MIPPDVASSLRVVVPDQQTADQARQTAPVAPTQRITDVLSNLVPGQRVFAEIQAMLPNGTYRATVAQRDVTLALPFSAKPGDSLELEVAESDGKLTLAFVANRSDAAARSGDQSVATSLSRTGQLIGNLMQGIEGEGKRAAAAPLNGNQALVPAMPKSAADLAPILKQALTQSGMFYEAHQARWVAGQLPTAALLEEPQGRQAPLMPPGSAPNVPGSKPMPDQGAAGQPAAPVGQNTAVNLPNGANPATAALPGDTLAGQPNPLAQPRGETPPPSALAVRAEPSPPLPGTNIPRDIAPIVQQQLDGLANQSFAWQGQVWPGQPMWWEIGENPEDRHVVGDEMAARWHTRLKLTLPELGGIDATLHLQPGGELGIRVLADSPAAEARLQAGLDALQRQMEAAGLNVRQLLIRHAAPEAS